MAVVWKSRPNSFPDDQETQSAAELNQFNDITDIESESKAILVESTLSVVPTDEVKLRRKNNLNRARDSIFVAKVARHRKSVTEGDEEEDELPDEQLVKNTLYNSGGMVEAGEGPSRTSDSPRRPRSQVQFSYHLPRQTSKTNPAFVDDDGQLGEENSYVQFAESTMDEVDLESSDDDDETSEETPPWDSFKSIPLEDEDDTLSSDWAKFFLKLLKLFSYGITFLLVLFTGVLAKLLLHLMANMTRVDKAVRVCRKLLPPEDRDKSYHSVLSVDSPERIAWIWTLYFVVTAPDLLLFIRSIRTCLFKKYSSPDRYLMLAMLVSSSAEVLGVSILVYLVLPWLDISTGLILTNSLLVVPALFQVIGRQHPSGSYIRYIYIGALVCQLVSLVAWPLLVLWQDSTLDQSNLYRDNVHLAWFAPLAGLLISFGHWENFITNSSPVAWMRNLAELKKTPVVSKYAMYLVVSVWKCVLHLIAMVIAQGFIAAYHQQWRASAFSDMAAQLFSDFGEAFSQHSVQLVRENSDMNDLRFVDSDPWLPIVMGIIQTVAAYFCFQTVHFVCKICIQPFSFAMPINLVLPVSISVSHLLVDLYLKDTCSLGKQSSFFEYTFFNVHYSLFDYDQPLDYLFYLMWAMAFVSQVVIVNHIWVSAGERLASCDQLFQLPQFCSALVDQSIMLNRRIERNTIESEIDQQQQSSTRKDILYDSDSIASGVGIESSDSRIRIYACATVWHETADELLQMLKSIMRMDQDQCTRRLAVQWLNVTDRQADYYEFETHLLVDDAFAYGAKYRDNENDLNINQYVQTLIQVLDEAAQNVHQRFIRIRPPKIFLTPYGGRLEWRLPGGTKLIAHLKDKARIRHRKRWSQVMYMYYLLGYKIYQQEMDTEKRNKIAENTFILALDGDINFRPEAVLLLVDLMRKNKNLGAACGRVHPVGTGPMAWYQKFEYAISHWLQKATEHVFGCVLCSPGCFSLFRASSLVDINVMHRYTTKPTEALHYVQYDQGEDRWLCTLLLQQGWRVEYSAASDAFTHCPEGFDEFYIQRRRWAPSTMANIIDLLQSYRHTVRVNDNISSLYMLYQAGLMLGTILSPGTIFLMLVGAMNTSFSLPNQYSFYINFVPVFIFILVCFFTKTEVQILVAQILSTFYAMLMLAVLVSTAIEIYKESILSPNVIFFVGMITVFIISAVIHPQEFSCLFPAFIYLLTIPSMYLLLTIYSIINLNIVSWGTRETPSSQVPQKQQAQQPQQNKDEGFLTEISNYFTRGPKWDFSCLCCASRRSEDELYLLRDIKESLGRVTTEVHEIKSQVGPSKFTRRNSLLMTRRNTRFNLEAEPLLDGDENAIDELDEVLDEEESFDENDEASVNLSDIDLEQPRWINDSNLQNAKVLSIKKEEENFWTLFIGKYLKPLDEDKAHQKKVKDELIDLRNKAFFAFGIINVVFVLFVYLLQLHKDIFSFTFKISSTLNGTDIDPDTGEEVPHYEPKKIQMDPVGLILIIFFGAILLIQFVGMFLHRFGTLTHLLAFTDLNFFQVKEEDIQDDSLLDQNAVQIVQYILDKHDDDDEDNASNPYFNMSKFFTKAYFGIRPDKQFVKDLRLRRKSTVKALLSRRDTIVEVVRRKSLAVQNSLELLGKRVPEAVPEVEEEEEEVEVHSEWLSDNEDEEPESSVEPVEMEEASAPVLTNFHPALHRLSANFTDSIVTSALTTLGTQPRETTSSPSPPDVTTRL